MIFYLKTEKYTKKNCGVRLIKLYHKYSEENKKLNFKFAHEQNNT